MKVKPKLLEIVADPLKQKILVYPYFPNQTFRAFDAFVIAKKDGSDFETSEIRKIRASVDDKKKLFQLDRYEIISMQIETEKPLRYKDYRGKERRIGVFVKSAKTENDKLLYHLYKQVDQP